MKAQHLIAAAIVAITTQHFALAQDTAAPRTRAEVRAELEQARADGTLETRNNYHGVALAEPFTSTKTREQVKAELAATPSLEVVRNYQGQSTDLAFTSTKSRADVRAEVLQAIASGEQLSRGEGHEV